jgi:uncharacterized protein YqgC (DUF456 family)
MTIALIIFGLLLAIVGLIGCILPIIPGPIFSFLSLIILSLAKDWEPFSLLFLLVMAGLTFFVTTLDYIIPVVSAKKSGATKLGLWLSVIGMLVGILFFPPWGMLIGAFIGGILGEIMAGNKGKDALKVGWGIFLGNMLGIGFKLAFSLVVIFFYIKAVLSG